MNLTRRKRKRITKKRKGGKLNQKVAEMINSRFFERPEDRLKAAEKQVVEDEQLLREQFDTVRAEDRNKLEKRREAQRLKRDKRRKEQLRQIANNIMGDADAASDQLDAMTEAQRLQAKKRLGKRLAGRVADDIMDTADDPNNIYDFFIENNAESIQCGNSESGVLECLEINAKKKNLDYIRVTYNAPNTFSGNRSLRWESNNINDTQKKVVTEQTKEVTYHPANAWKSPTPLVYFEDSKRNYRKVPLKDVIQIELKQQTQFRFGGKRKNKTKRKNKRKKKTKRKKRRNKRRKTRRK